MQLTTTPTGSMPKKAFEIGLCFNCHQIATCIARRRAPNGYVMFCNEHDASLPPEEEEARKLKAWKRPSADSISSAPSPDDELDRSYRGLCMSCKWRTTCRHSHTEGGVWHCAEFE